MENNTEEACTKGIEEARLAKLRFQISSLNESSKKRFLTREIATAVEKLKAGDIEYASQFRKDFVPIVRRLKFREIFVAQDKNSNIKLVLLGILTYSFVVFVAGICAVIVNTYLRNTDDELVKLVGTIGLLPIFITVSDLGIKPVLYLWGVMGGAGAVVSIVKRIDEINGHKTSSWSLFAQGLFNPIVGSLAAIVVCTFVNAGLLNILSPVPLVVISFFSGFTERLLEKVGVLVIPQSADVEAVTVPSDNDIKGIK